MAHPNAGGDPKQTVEGRIGTQPRIDSTIWLREGSGQRNPGYIYRRLLENDKKAVRIIVDARDLTDAARDKLFQDVVDLAKANIWLNAAILDVDWALMTVSFTNTSMVRIMS